MPRTTTHYVEEQLAPKPRRVKRWRTKRLPGGELLRIAVVPGEGERGGHTIATSLLIPRKKEPNPMVAAPNPRRRRRRSTSTSRRRRRNPATPRTNPARNRLGQFTKRRRRRR